MDIKHFTNERPGKLVPIETKWGSDYAFIPDPLPPDWKFPSHLWPLLADAKEQVALLEGVGRGLANPNILLQPLSGQEAIQSSALEGTFATPEQMLLFELDPQQPSSEDDPANANLEVTNYRKALQHGLESELPLSLRLVRNMHRVLLTGVRGKDQSPGEFRRIQVGIGKIGAKARFVPPPHQHLLDCLDPLEKYLHIASSSFDPLVDCFLAHYQFETIHPFNDGNGRVGRLLLAIMLQQKCRLTKPWLYMSDYFNRNRDEYVQYLFSVSAKGDWANWIGFCLQGTVEQAKATVAKCEQLRQLKDDYMQRLQNISGTTRLIQIIDRIFESPFLRISDLQDLLDVSYPTARSDAQRLVEAKILQELPNTWPKVFYPPEVLRISYENLE